MYGKYVTDNYISYSPGEKSAIKSVSGTIINYYNFNVVNKNCSLAFLVYSI